MIEFLRRQAGAGKPFFAVNSYYPPHDPFTAPSRYYQYYRSKGVPFAGYYAAVSALDDDVGRIQQALEELDLADNTLLVYYSDHGETFNYRSESRHKFVCYDDAVRVPLMACWPRKITPGQVSTEFVGLEDLMPTVLDCADLPQLDYLDGYSLTPVFEQAHGIGREGYYVQNRTMFDRWEQRAIRTSGWKLILSDDGPNSLFDLGRDPEEELNIYETPRDDPHNRFRHFPPYTDVIVRLATLLQREAKRLEDPVGIDLAGRALAEMKRCSE